MIRIIEQNLYDLIEFCEFNISGEKESQPP